jgi:pimeloyl-ACP methyl ester carboxylesterase
LPTARNGEVEIYYESFGDPEDPTLLLANGLGSQCINYAVEWCQLFCEEGFHVVRFDNRDVGLSTKLDGVDYSLADMADDAIAVLNALGVQRAHVMGCSMGGMIVQRLAIDHAARLLSITSVMSHTGEKGYGESSEAALAFLTSKPATWPSAPVPAPPTTVASVPQGSPGRSKRCSPTARAPRTFGRSTCQRS